MDVVSVLKPVLVRAGRTYLQVLLGVLTAKGFGVDAGVLPHDFFPALVVAAEIAAGPAVIAILQNISELLAGVGDHTLRG